MNGDDPNAALTLRGLPPTAEAQPEEEEAPPTAPGTVSVQDAPEHMPLPPETMVVRGMYYGKNFKEFNHDANYGPEGQELQDDDVALSPNVADRLGLTRGDKVWVGNQLHTYNDVSAYTPTHMTTDSVEVRNYPLDGKIQIRKALPEEVQRQSGRDLRQMPDARQASYMTGLDPSQITAQSVNAFLQPQIERQRGLIAGNVTGASTEDWNLDQLNQQNEVAASASADSSGEVTPESMGLEPSLSSQLGAAGNVTESAPGQGMPVPDMSGAHIVERPSNGDLVWSNGVVGHPQNGSVSYTVGPQTVVWYPNGKTKSYDTISVYRDPATGYTYNKNAPGMPRLHLEGQIEDLKPLPNGQLPTGEAALDGLTEPQKSIIKMIANYQMVLPPGAMRSPAFLPYLARVSAYDPDYSMMKAAGRQQMIKSIASMNPNSAGYMIQSANTMLEHLRDLYEDSQKLPLHDWKTGNKFENFLKDNAGSPTVSNFQFDKTALLTELTKTLKGGVADDSDMRRWEQSLNAADSAAQMNDIIKKDFPNILAGRLNGFRTLYQDVMDHPFEKTDRKTGVRTTLVSPQNSAWLKSIGYDGNIDAGDPVPQPTKETQNVQAGLPPKGTIDTQGAMLWLARNPDAPGSAEVRDRLQRMGALTTPSPPPATASK
jgi:hypothetical protein